jgi:hypothetical protein
MGKNIKAVSHLPMSPLSAFADTRGPYGGSVAPSLPNRATRIVPLPAWWFEAWLTLPPVSSGPLTKLAAIRYTNP